MPDLTSLTTEQLQSATKAQIIANVSGVLTAKSKRDLVVLLLGTDRVSDVPKCVYRKEDGQIESQTEVFRDAETGARTGGCVTTWSYYEKTGCVDEIAISQRDAADKETAKVVIKHYEDGRQPKKL